jgi:hypothetical protein
MNSPTTFITVGLQIMAKVGRAEHRCGCSIFSKLAWGLRNADEHGADLCSIFSKLAWGLRNADEHGADLETQRIIRLVKAERAIRRLYREGDSLPMYEWFPFHLDH